MKLVLQDKNQYVLKIENGEELVEQIKQFCKQEGVQAGTFTCIGAVNEAEVRWYNLAEKKYQPKRFAQQMEIASGIGNVSLLENNLVVHLHCVFSGEDYTTVAGDVSFAKVSGACEVMFTKLEGVMQKAYDPETGLNLML